MELPDEMISFTMQKSKEKQLVRNAMMLYPYIQEGRISHGKAAEILGIFKMDSGEQEMAWCHGAGGIALSRKLMGICGARHYG